MQKMFEQYAIFALVAMLSLWSARGHTEPQDVYALRILYESLKSPALSGWNSNGGDPCGDLWQGVECSGHNVIAIRLPGLRLRGSIGFSLNKFTSLLTLDLSNNHIGEMLPFQLPPRIVQLYLGNNVIIGSIPYSMKRLMSLTNLNLSRNFLSGEVPDIFQKLSNLQTLDISNNNFTGELPESLGALLSLSTFHLQQNQLNGTLDVLAKLPLKDLDIENNQFSGSMPSGLRSLPIFRQSPRPHKYMSKSPEGSSSLTGPMLAGIISGGVVVAFVFTVVLFMLVRRRNSNKHAGEDDAASAESNLPGFLIPHGSVKDRFDDSQLPSPDRMLRPLPMERFKPPIQKTSGHLITLKGINVSISAAAYSFHELQSATCNFSKENLIGEGLLGRVYKGNFANGKVLAIKKLESSSFATQKDEEVLAIISNMARLHHANITELVGYCLENGQCLLVYPYFSKGALHDSLHSRNGTHKGLSWNERMKISLGAARALEYLHEVCVPLVVHRNFKSANILLDAELNPHVSDSGLAALVPFGTERQISAQMLGSFGYSAPEYALAGIYTVKSDVYSFGAVMLELLTGREPLDSTKPRSKEQSLVAWATPQLHDIDCLARIADPSMEGMYPTKALSRFAEIIAQCVQVEPEFRPPMSEVVQSLVRLMQRASMTKRTTSQELAPHRSAMADSSDKSFEKSSSLEKSFETHNLADKNF